MGEGKCIFADILDQNPLPFATQSRYDYSPSCIDLLECKTTPSAVGYQQYELQVGFNLFAPVFESLSPSGYDLQDMKIVNPQGGEYIQTLDADGIAGDSYDWRQNRTTGEYSWQLSRQDVVGETISAGGGFYIYVEEKGEDGPYVQLSGSVRPRDVEIPLKAGFNLVGNSSPVNLDLQQLKIKNPQGGEYIQTLDADGIAGDSYDWRQNRTTGEYSWQLSRQDVVGVTVKAGEGLYVYAEEDGASLVIPSAIKTVAE